MLTYDRLLQAVREDAAVRRIRRLQPVGGRGDKIFPPTYPGEGRNNAPPRHVFEYRRFDNANVLCVLIDSVQSQANRLEEALKTGRDRSEITFPVIAVDFSKTDVPDLGQITTLEAPHRVFDAIIRDSELDKKRFRDTDEGRRLIQATTRDARAVYELSPSALIFGAWNSTGEGGGLGAKFPRAVVSEIIGVGVATEPAPANERPRASGSRPGSRIDPLGIRSGVKVYKQPNGDWDFKPSKLAQEVRPSEVNHSNIAPSVQPLGVSIDYALHSFVLSFTALRRLRFGETSPAAELAARTALAALGLAAQATHERAGYFLRSRCELVPEEAAAPLELIKANGTRETIELTVEAALQLARAAQEAAAKHSIAWRAQDLIVNPQGKLVELVQKSRERALEGTEDDEQGEQK